MVIGEANIYGIRSRASKDRLEHLADQAQAEDNRHQRGVIPTPGQEPDTDQANRDDDAADGAANGVHDGDELAKPCEIE
jgi:hypothetical protein